MQLLADDDLHALRNLAEKKAGNAVPFINIAAARRLTEMGFASRSREGWEITAEGSAALARCSPPPV
jgi:hypothetical protein